MITEVAYSVVIHRIGIIGTSFDEVFNRRNKKISIDGFR